MGALNVGPSVLLVGLKCGPLLDIRISDIRFGLHPKAHGLGCRAYVLQGSQQVSPIK